MAAQPPAEGGWQTPVDLDIGPAPGVRFASPSARLIAYIVDALIVSLLGIILWVILAVLVARVGSGGTDVLAGIGIALVFVVWLALTFAYFPWFWARRGQTPGMWMQHIKVVRDADGGPVSAGSAVLRLIGYWINGLVLYIGFIWILVDKRRRGWHDLIAGTCVIED